MSKCNHKNVYYGVVNIKHGRSIVGAIDVWRCLICKKIFAEEKRLGILDIAAEVGMPYIEDDEQWFILTCKLRSDWALVKVKSNGYSSIKHECIDGGRVLSISNFRIDDAHRLIPVHEVINMEVELE